MAGSKFPDTSFISTYEGPTTPTTRAEARRVHQRAYERLLAGQMTDEEFTLQKDLCERVTRFKETH